MTDAIDSMKREIQNTFPDLVEKYGEIQFHKPQGGYFIWIQFPEWMDSSNFLPELLKQFNTSYMSGEFASYDLTMGSHAIRLCFVYYPPSTLVQGIKNLEIFLIAKLKAINC